MTCEDKASTKGLHVLTWSGAPTQPPAPSQPECDLAASQTNVKHIVRITNRSMYRLELECQASLSRSQARFDFSDCPPRVSGTDDDWSAKDQVGDYKVCQLDCVTLQSESSGFDTVNVEVVGSADSWVQEKPRPLAFDITT